MPDYRGYGKSSGRASEVNMHSDCFFIYNKLKEMVPEKNIILYGRSLGSGVATRLATKVHPAYLILETPFLISTEVTFAGLNALEIYNCSFLV